MPTAARAAPGISLNVSLKAFRVSAKFRTAVHLSDVIPVDKQTSYTLPADHHHHHHHHHLFVMKQVQAGTWTQIGLRVTGQQGT